MVKIQLIHGASLNLLAGRGPAIYGNFSLKEIDDQLHIAAKENRAQLRVFQSNSEGAIIDVIHEAANWADGILINPGAFGATSYAIADALSAVGLPAIEVHISNVQAREEWRRRSVLGPVVMGYIGGLGWRSYLYGLQALIAIIDERAGPASIA